MQSRSIYEFGSFRIECAERRLLRDGCLVPLTPKAFDVLVLLVENSGHVVAKDALMEQVWANSFVEESNLKVTISMLRKALARAGEPSRYIETVAKHGYRFVAQVKPLSEAGSELIIHELTRASVTIEQEEEAAPVIIASQLAAAQNLTAKVHLRKRDLLRLFVLSALGIGILTIGLYKLFAPHQSASLFQLGKIARLTTTGKARVATLSPDGKLFACSLQDELASLWLGRVDGGELLQIHAPVAGFFLSLTFAPDSNSVFYTFTDNLLPVSQFGSTGTLYKMPVFGGAPEKVKDNVRNSITFSPDGKQFAFVRSEQGGNETALTIADTQGSGERELARSPGRQGFAWYSPSWSPDGATLAIGATINDRNADSEVVLVNVDSGAMQPLTRHGWSEVVSTIWQHDGKGLIVIASDKYSTLYQLWSVSYPEGEVHRIVTDLATYGFSVSLSADDHALLVTQAQDQSDIWVAPVGNLRQAKQITFSSLGRQNGYKALDWTPDNHIIYTARAGEGWSLWTMNPDGSEWDQAGLIPGTLLACECSWLLECRCFVRLRVRFLYSKINQLTNLSRKTPVLSSNQFTINRGIFRRPWAKVC